MLAGGWLGYIAPLIDDYLDTPTLPQYLPCPIVNVRPSVSVTSSTHAHMVPNWCTPGMCNVTYVSREVWQTWTNTMGSAIWCQFLRLVGEREFYFHGSYTMALMSMHSDWMPTALSGNYINSLSESLNKFFFFFRRMSGQHFAYCSTNYT